MRAVIYCRTSVDDKDILKKLQRRKESKENCERSLKESITEQINGSEELAKKAKYQIVDKYVDSGLSSASYPDDEKGRLQYALDDEAIKHFKGKPVFRPALAKMLANISNYDVIIIRDESRLFREAEDSKLRSHIVSILKAHNVKVHSYTGRLINYKDWSDRFTSKITGDVDRKLVDDRIKTSHRNRKQRQDEGYMTSGAQAFGWVGNRRGRIVWDDTKLDWVKWVFVKYTNEKWSLANIVRELNSKKVKCLRKGKWHKNKVLRMLRRLEYCGKTKNTKGEIIDCKNFIDAKRTPPISFELWEKTQKRLEDITPFNFIRLGVVRPLSGSLKCGICGYNLKILTQGTKRRLNVYYVCANSHLSKVEERGDCSKVLVRVGEGAKHAGAETSLMPLVFFAIAEHVRDQQKDTKTSNQIAVIKRDIENIVKRNALNYKEFQDNQITAEMWNEYKKQDSSLIQQKKELLSTIESNESQKLDCDIKVLMDYFWKMHNKNLEPDTYKELLKRAIINIQVYPNHYIVNLRNGKTIELQRVPWHNGRHFPSWQADIWHKDLKLNAQEMEGFDNIKYSVTYKYFTAWKDGAVEPVKTIYEDEQIVIRIVGENVR